MIVDFVSTQPFVVNKDFDWEEPPSSGKHMEGWAFDPNVDSQLIYQRGVYGNFGRQEGQAIFRFDDRVIVVILHAVSNSGTDRCQVNGVAIPAPG